MPSFGAEPEAVGGRRQMVLAAVVLALAVATGQLSQTARERIAFALRASVLRPFIATQEVLAEARVRAGQVEVLMARLDSLTGIVATQSALVDENRTLRDLLGLEDRAGPSYLPATVLRPGSEGSESIFLIDLGLEDGIRDGSAVVSSRGLVGVIREARERSSVGMDWSHRDFRASAMLVDGSVYGIVENRRGEFREEDRLLLDGAAYHVEVRPGALVITSGLGVLPRGIPIGRIDTIAGAQGSWRKSYWLRPVVMPGAATHVLVVTTEPGEDVSHAWPTRLAEADSAERDSLAPESAGRLADAAEDGASAGRLAGSAGGRAQAGGGEADASGAGDARAGGAGAAPEAFRSDSVPPRATDSVPEPLVVPLPGPPPAATRAPALVRDASLAAPFEDADAVDPPADPGADTPGGVGGAAGGDSVPYGRSAAARDSAAAADSTVAGADTAAADSAAIPDTMTAPDTTGVVDTTGAVDTTLVAAAGAPGESASRGRSVPGLDTPAAVAPARGAREATADRGGPFLAAGGARGATAGRGGSFLGAVRTREAMAARRDPVLPARRARDATSARGDSLLGAGPAPADAVVRESLGHVPLSALRAPEPRASPPPLRTAGPAA